MGWFFDADNQSIGKEKEKISETKLCISEKFKEIYVNERSTKFIVMRYIQ